MEKFVILLLFGSAFISVVHGWSDERWEITSDICVNNIERLENSYDPTTQVDDDDEPALIKFEEIRDAMRQKLLALIPAARKQKTVKMYQHELRSLQYWKTRIFCDQNTAYEVVKICMDAVEEVSNFSYNRKLAQATTVKPFRPYGSLGNDRVRPFVTIV